jgi:hypothetical protein
MQVVGAFARCGDTGADGLEFAAQNRLPPERLVSWIVEHVVLLASSSRFRNGCGAEEAAKKVVVASRLRPSAAKAEPAFNQLRTA